MDIETKYYLIGLIFPEKLQFQKNKYQTTKINEFVNTILSDNAGHSAKIKRLTSISESQSHQVIRAGTLFYLVIAIFTACYIFFKDMP